MSVIEVRKLTKRYPKPAGVAGSAGPADTFYAVDHISLAIEAGEIYGILGPNGAGKTTTLEMLEGLTDIDEGEAHVGGIDVRLHPYEVKKIIGVQLQTSEYFDKLNLLELLDLFGRLYGRAVNGGELLSLVNLESKAREKPDNLSGGQLQRFSIACALVNEPMVLFLDEPTTGLDPQARRSLWDLVRTLNQEGMTIVLTTHNMEEAEKLCHRIAIMDEGRIVAEDTPQKLIMDYAPEPPVAPSHGNMEDVFLALTGHALRD